MLFLKFLDTGLCMPLDQVPLFCAQAGQLRRQDRFDEGDIPQASEVKLKTFIYSKCLYIVTCT